MSVINETYKEIACSNRSIFEERALSELSSETNIDYERKSFISNLSELPIDYVLISHRLDEIKSLIQRNLPNKGDMERYTEKIISQQKREISELKSLLQDLVNALSKRSIASILMYVSLAGLIVSLAFLILTYFKGRVILSPLHFILLTVIFLFILILTFFSKKEYKRI
jgi:hypothetical protein